MKEVFKKMVAILAGLAEVVMPDDEEVKSAISELLELIDNLDSDGESADGESADGESAATEEIENKISALVAKLSKSDGAKNESVKNQLKNLQKSVLNLQDENLKNALEKIKAKNQSKKVGAKNTLPKFDLSDVILNLKDKGAKRTPVKEAIKNYVIEIGGQIETDIDEPVIFSDEVQTTIEEKTDFLKDLRYLGINDFTITINPYDESDNNQNAKGHSRLAEKADQKLPITTKVITSGEFYKKLTLSYSKLKKGDPLVKFRAKELPVVWKNNLMNRILVGGLSTDSTDRIIPIYREESDNFVTVSQFLTPTPNIGDVRKAVTTIRQTISDGVSNIYLVANSATLEALKSKNSVLGIIDYYSNEELAEKTMVNHVIDNSVIPNGAVVIFDASKYGVTGTNTAEILHDYDININGDIVEVVGIVGGDFINYKGGAVVLPLDPDTTPIDPDTPEPSANDLLIQALNTELAKIEESPTIEVVGGDVANDNVKIAGVNAYVGSIIDSSFEFIVVTMDNKWQLLITKDGLSVFKEIKPTFVEPTE